MEQEYDILVIEKELKEATEHVKRLDKMKKDTSYRHLSDYSKNLHETNYREAVEKQVDAVEKLTYLVIQGKLTKNEVKKIINRAAK